MRYLMIALALALAAPATAAAQPAPSPSPPAAEGEEDDLELPAAEPTPAPAPTPTPPVAPAVDAALLARIERLEQRAEAAEARAQAAETRPATPARDRDAKFAGFGVWAYVQSQYEANQASEDQVQQGGDLLNQDEFVVRRARFGVDREWKHAEVAVELDANTLRGASVGLRRAEAALRWPGAPDRPPLAQLTVGLSDIPFGLELPTSGRARLFMERSAASLALFPGEADLGARVWGAVGFFDFAIAAMAGEPIGERSGRTGFGDPNAAKDFLGRVGVSASPTGAVHIAGGVSVLAGTGFHEGTSATKDDVEWRDLNENGAIDTGELRALPGAAALPSENFDRWAIGGDIDVRVQTSLGESRLSAEVTVASNLDRGLFIADPIEAGLDVRHFGAYVAAIQQVAGWGVVGVRYDVYNPNLDFFDERAGMVVPTSSTISTLAPLIGARLPWRTKLLFQYDWIRDQLARDDLGVPTDLANNRWTVRLQVEL